MRRLVTLALVVLASTPVPIAAAASSARLRSALLSRINTARTAHGLRPLVDRRSLARVAGRQTAYLARIRFLTHDSPDGSPAASRIRASFNAGLIGETIAFGSSARWIVNAWLHSPAHRAILLDPGFRWIGIGALSRHGTIWATADLGS